MELRKHITEKVQFYSKRIMEIDMDIMEGKNKHYLLGLRSGYTILQEELIQLYLIADKIEKGKDEKIKKGEDEK